MVRRLVQNQERCIAGKCQRQIKLLPLPFRHLSERLFAKLVEILAQLEKALRKCMLAGECVRAVWFITAGARRFAVDGCSFAVCHSAADARRFATGVGTVRRSRSIFCLYHCRKHLPCRQIKDRRFLRQIKNFRWEQRFVKLSCRAPEHGNLSGLRCFHAEQQFDQRGFSSAVLAPDDVVLS